MATTYSISQKSRLRGGFHSPEKIKELLERNSKWPAETYKILANSDDLAASTLNRDWGIVIKHQDGTVRLVRGGRA
jgi:hypothetical protein